MNMNALRELMDFANKNQMFGKGWDSAQSSYDPSGRRAEWATNMLMRQSEAAPDFGADEGPELAPLKYQEPRRINASPIAPQQEQPGMMQNFLRTLFETHPYGTGARRTGTGGIRG